MNEPDDPSTYYEVPEDRRLDSDGGYGSTALSEDEAAVELEGFKDLEPGRYGSMGFVEVADKDLP